MCGSVNAGVPSNPTQLTNTTGNYWVNHTWYAGIGHNTDSYNVSVNGIWYNGTIDVSFDTCSFYNASYSLSAWQNITVYAYNETGDGNLSAANVSQNTQAPIGFKMNLAAIIAILNQIPDILEPIPDILAAMATVVIYAAVIVLAIGIVYKLRDVIGGMLKMK